MQSASLGSPINHFSAIRKVQLEGNDIKFIKEEVQNGSRVTPFLNSVIKEAKLEDFKYQTAVVSSSNMLWLLSDRHATEFSKWNENHNKRMVFYSKYPLMSYDA